MSADYLDDASEAEQRKRDAGIARRRQWASIDVAPRVCAGCDFTPQGRECADYADCLKQWERRQDAARRNGRSVG